jgi:hypothetical protein
MRNFLKKIIAIIGIVIVFSTLLSNATQPGIWNAGGSGSFKLLFEEDSLAYKKIQMQSEAIYMQLHKGFAVVKGEYNFLNSTDTSITIKVGYPINNVFPPTAFKNSLNEVVFDDLYKIKGAVNGTEIPLILSPNVENENWYVWELTFPPKETIKFTVHFLVNTNNSKTVKGYTNDYKNAFIYLIETGSLWKSPIEKGDFYVQFMDEISIEDCKISAPTDLKINSEKNIVYFQMVHYGLQPDANLIITYAKKNPAFDFKSVVDKSDNYFSEINSFSNSNLNIPFETASFKNPYEPESNWKILGFIFDSVLFVFKNFIYFLIVAVAIVFLIIYRNKKRKLQ